MKIHCTLKEFECLLAYCPVNHKLMEFEESNSALDKCGNECVLRRFCPYGQDIGSSFADICVIESEVAE